MSVLLALDYFGVFVFAVSGALMALRKQMDLFGVLVLALLPAVGGGTLRDLLLDVPVFWIEDTKQRGSMLHDGDPRLLTSCQILSGLELGIFWHIAFLKAQSRHSHFR